MIWAIVGVVVSFFLYRVFGDPARSAKALWFSSMRAYGRKRWRIAAEFCHEGLANAAKLKEPLRSRLEAPLEIQLARVLHRQGKLAEAEETLARGLAKAQNLFAANSEMLLAAELLWGDLCSDSARHTEAEAHYRKAVEGDEAAANLPGTIFDLQRLTDCLMRQGRMREAEQVCLQAIGAELRQTRQLAARQGRDLDNSVITAISQPKLHFCREQYDEAAGILRTQVENWKTAPHRPDNIDIGEMLIFLALSETRAGQLETAAATYEQAAAQFESDWCAGHPKAIAARAAKAALELPAPVQA